MDSLVEDFLEHDSVMNVESMSLGSKLRRVSELDDQLITFDKSVVAGSQRNDSPENYESVFAESRLATELTQRSIRVSTFGDDI